ncbi:MAG: 50S ribosomal protein L22 [Proteobacteria bacterium]|jgi:large subunit ribosomal protein L22|nr:50S ribosomal protein L22 [Pseudomonadota bacterium]NLN61625.1 50S ribosomal protein L22 [Myxococcales bacterium]
MEARASARYVKISPRKVRVLASLLRGKNVGEAIQTLTFINRSAALPLKKVLESAVANAKQANSALDPDALFIKTLQVNMGPTQHMRRWRPRAQGRATRIVKGVSHIDVVLGIR